MQILLGQVLLDADDNPMEFTKETYLQTEQGTLVKREKTGQQFTLRDAAKNALLTAFDDEKNMSPEEKDKRWDLFKKVKNCIDPVELTVEEVSTLKKLIGKNPSLLISGQGRELLEKGKIEIVKKEDVKG